ncbi:DNA polymerase phi-domain-containing protein [Auriculariales sp. MPI-PUGE-AT-0066]|nr:DNA polymerase phi-domain-containing protein [Auriculariales sp. MPI-PUGE-AT-0066]
MSSTLEYFWHLSSANKASRLNASEQLVSTLEKFQAAHPAPQEDGDRDDLEGKNAPDVTYAIKRLVRGLASPRESSRLGFSVALTELLSRIETVTASQMIMLISDASQTTGSMKGHEERDMLFARLFGLTALAQSRLLVHQTLSSEEEVQLVVKLLDELGGKKSWLREGAAWATARVLEALCASKASWTEKAAKHIVSKMLENERDWTPDKVALILLAQKWFPDLKWKKLLAPTFKDANILAATNLAILARILKEGSVDEDVDKSAANAGTWQPQLPFVWDVIADALCSSDTTQRQVDVVPVQDFFRIAVDESFFATSASSERKYWGFLIFQKFASRVPPSELPLLLTRNFMRTWINHLSHTDRYLHKIAKQVAQDVQKIVSNEPRAGFALMLELLGRNGNRQFDQITRTKTVESILSSMSPTGIDEYAAHLFAQLSEEETDSENAYGQSKQLWVVDQLSALVRNASVPKDDACIKNILGFFVLHGFFTVQKASNKSKIMALRHIPQPPFTDDLRQECRTRLLACLADLLTQTPNKKTTVEASTSATPVRQAGYAQDGELWLAKVWSIFADLEKDKHVSLTKELAEVETELRAKVTAALAILEKAPADKQEPASGVQLLLTGGLLQLYADQDANAAEELEDCTAAVSRMFSTTSPTKAKSKGKDKKGKDNAKESGDSETAPEPISVFVDFLVGCLDRGSAYSRAIATRAFEPLCSALTQTSVKFILDQLERRPVTATRDDEDIDMQEDDAQSDAESHASHSDSQAEQEHSGSEESESSEDDDEGEEDQEDEEDDGDEEGDADAELRARLEEALRLSGMDPAENDGSEDEELMDDDQMMQFDEQLAVVFKTRKSEKSGAKQNLNAQREATHFKNRVLDLVDIYIRKESTSPHIPTIVLPLLDLITGTGQDEKQLQEKTAGILRSRLSKTKELPRLQDLSEARDVFAQLHSHARRSRSGAVVGVISQCTVYIARVLVHNGDGTLVSQVYGESLKDYATRKASSLNAAFFLEFVKRLPQQAFGTGEALIDAMRKPHNFYRATQLFNVFQAVASQLSQEQLKQSLSKLCPAFCDVLYGTISSACTDEPAPKAAQLRDVTKVGYSYMRASKRADLSAAAFEKLWDGPRLRALVDTVKGCERFKTAAALHSSLRQMSGLVSGQASQPKIPGKRRAPEGDSEDRLQRKKVRKSKD